MPLLTQYQSFFISPFSEPSVTSELNSFLKSHRIINVEKKLIDGERGTGWAFLIEYSDYEIGKTFPNSQTSKVDYKDVLNPTEFAIFDNLRKVRKEISDKTRMPLYGIFSNEQLSLMAKNPPKTKDEFLQIKGVNEQKFKQFGEIFLNALKSVSSSNPSDSSETSEQVPF